jgi:hypothetical protein
MAFRAIFVAARRFARAICDDFDGALPKSSDRQRRNIRQNRHELSVWKAKPVTFHFGNSAKSELGFEMSNVAQNWGATRSN